MNCAGQSRSRVVLALTLAVTLQGCVSAQVAGTPTTNLAAVKAGMTRAQIESILGAHNAQWATAKQVIYRTYSYKRVSATGKGLVAGDILTLGLVSLMVEDFVASKDPNAFAESAPLTLSFDADDKVLGVFPDAGVFQRFPEDGRPPAR